MPQATRLRECSRVQPRARRKVVCSLSAVEFQEGTETCLGLFSGLWICEAGGGGGIG